MTTSLRVAVKVSLDLSAPARRWCGMRRPPGSSWNPNIHAESPPVTRLLFQARGSVRKWALVAGFRTSYGTECACKQGRNLSIRYREVIETLQECDDPFFEIAHKCCPMFHPRRREQSDWSIRSLKVCMQSAVTDAARFQPGRFGQGWKLSRVFMPCVRGKQTGWAWMRVWQRPPSSHGGQNRQGQMTLRRRQAVCPEDVHGMPITCPWLRPWARCRTSCDASCAPDAPATRCVPLLDQRWPSSAGCQRRSLPLPWPWPVGSAHGTFRESGQRRSTACLSATACVPPCLPLASRVLSRALAL